jgi:carboxyl-terminal processing protease
MIRLTIARYYSPSGRCIQKPYTAGDNKDYEEDILTRYEHGEFFSGDSIKHEGKEYHTANGRPVYGGGGITPDIFVAEDTTNVTSYYKQASISGQIIMFAYSYTDENRQKLSQLSTVDEMAVYLKRQNIVDKFATYADNNGLKRRNLMIQRSYKLLERYIISRIIYNMMKEEAWIQYLNHDDPAIMETLHVMREGNAFPKNNNKQ